MRKLVAFIVALSLVSLTSGLSNTAIAKGDPELQLVKLAIAHVTVDTEGLFAIDGKVKGSERRLLQSVFDPLNSNLRSLDKSMRLNTTGRDVQRTSSKGPGLNAPAALWCALVPKYAFQALAWYLIITGAAVSILGAMAHVTIIGIPAGVLFAAVGASIGMSGSYFLMLVNQNIPEWGKWVCW